MSIPLASSLTTLGYGLKDEDLDEIIIMEKMRDVSNRFTYALDLIKKRFNTSTRIRLIEFDRFSGVDEDAQAWCNALIDVERHLFYSTLYSNKDCCVIFVYSKHRKKPKVLQERLLPHEFAHHYQWQTEGFPFIEPKGCRRELLPQFADCHDFGPENGTTYIDNALLENNCVRVLKDFIERVSDYVCEMTLKQKGFWKGILNEYKAGRIEDPAASKYVPYASEVQKNYIRRLALYDVVEWEAMLTTAFPNKQIVNDLLKVEKERVIRLNRNFENAKSAYNAIIQMFSRTDYSSLKDVSKMIAFIKSAMQLLNIEIRTTESW